MDKQIPQEKQSQQGQREDENESYCPSTESVPMDQTSEVVAEVGTPTKEGGINITYTTSDIIAPASTSSMVPVTVISSTTDLNLEVPTEVLQTAQLLTEFSSKPAVNPIVLQGPSQENDPPHQHETSRSVESLLRSHPKSLVFVNPVESSVGQSSAVTTTNNSITLSDTNSQAVFIINHDGTMSTARKWGTYLCETDDESVMEHGALSQQNVVVVTNPGAEQHNADDTPANNIHQNFSDLTKVLMPVDSVVLRNIGPKLQGEEGGDHVNIHHQVGQESTGTDDENGKQVPHATDSHLLPPPPGPILFQVMKDDGTVQSVNINPVDQQEQGHTESMNTDQQGGNQTAYDPKKPYRCELCSASFTLLGNLNRHRMIHSINAKEDCRFKCNQCGRFFLQRCDLVRHADVHNKTEPYKCEICGKGYIRRSDLVIHRRFHKKEKHFQCSHCDKAYYQSGDLNRHVRSVHLQYKMLTCGHCKKKFTKEATLMRHMQANHRDIILQSVDQLTTQAESDLETATLEPCIEPEEGVMPEAASDSQQPSAVEQE